MVSVNCHLTELGIAWVFNLGAVLLKRMLDCVKQDGKSHSLWASPFPGQDPELR